MIPAYLPIVKKKEHPLYKIFPTCREREGNKPDKGGEMDTPTDFFFCRRGRKKKKYETNIFMSNANRKRPSGNCFQRVL